MGGDTGDREPRVMDLDDAERPNFEGHEGRECGEHRTVGSHRAWCYDCSEWCYPESPCANCELPAVRKALAERDAEIARLRAIVNRDRGDGYAANCCARCGHHADWHRHDDSDDTEPWRFRCLGGSSFRGCSHGCPDFVHALAAPTAPTELRADCGQPDHEWVPCSDCPRSPTEPCACTGEPCCGRKRDELAAPAPAEDGEGAVCTCDSRADLLPGDGHAAACPLYRAAPAPADGSLLAERDAEIAQLTGEVARLRAAVVARLGTAAAARVFALAAAPAPADNNNEGEQ